MGERLRGIRVLDFAGQLSLPWLGRHLAYHGAEVITVESSRFLPKIRGYVPPNAPERGVQPNDSPSLTDWHAGKISLGMDLTRPEVQCVLERLISVSDVVLSNRLPRAAAAMGVTHARVQSINPAAIMVHSTSYGFTGPYANNGAFGDHIEAVSGIAHLLRDPETGQFGSSNTLILDYISGLHGLFAVLEALRERRRMGKGKLIDLAMLETAVAGIGDVILEHAITGEEPEAGNHIPTAEPYGCFPCEHGDRLCTLGIHTEQQWAAFCSAMNHPEWLHDARFGTLEMRRQHRADIHAEVTRWTYPQKAYALMFRLQALGIPSGVIQEAPDLLQDPQLGYRRFFRIHSHSSKGGVIGTGLAVALDEPNPGALRTGFSLGEDTLYVLEEVAGISRGEVESLASTGAIEVGTAGFWPSLAAKQKAAPASATR